VLHEALEHLGVEAQPGGLEWGWEHRDTELAWMLWPVLRSAAELMVTQERQRVGVCPGCGWLFLDTSRSHNRRWCTMAVCGNRAKRRRHYRRERAGQEGETRDA
jgi:predicted RNA-binding Zn ribbon-like protein